MEKSEIEKQVINHLEFLGYEVKQISDGTDPGEVKTFEARHSLERRIRVFFADEIVGFNSTYYLSDYAKSNRQSLLEDINKLNKQSVVQHHITEVEGELSLNSTLVYYGLYVKKTFTKFVKRWEEVMIMTLQQMGNKKFLG